MADLGVRFGKALQMTNVLRDVPTDLRIGRCYIPEEWIQDVGLTPLDLMDPANGAAARPALVRGLVSARTSKDSGPGRVTAVDWIATWKSWMLRSQRRSTMRPRLSLLDPAEVLDQKLRRSVSAR